MQRYHTGVWYRYFLYSSPSVIYAILFVYLLEMKIEKAIITAAGFGSRFLPITKSFPKELLPILDKPVIHHLVDECAAADIKEVIIVASPAEVDKFEDYFFGRAINIRTLMIRQHKLERWSKVEKVFELPHITIVPQDESLPYGNGRPVLSVKELVENEEAFIVMFGDDITLGEVSAVKQMIDYFNLHPAAALLAVEEVADSEVSKYGIVQPVPDSDKVESLIEKPDISEAKSRLASYGRFVLTPQIFHYLKAEQTGKDGELWLQDANAKLAENGNVRFIKPRETKWMTTGDPLTYLQTHVAVALQDPQIGTQLKSYLQDLLRSS